MDIHQTHLIQCPCNNNHIILAETKPADESIYGFKTIVTITGGFCKLDQFNNVVCICGRKHSIKNFVSKFHRAAIAHFAKPPQPSQLALL
jgi:hypothetical protein